MNKILCIALPKQLIRSVFIVPNDYLFCGHFIYVKTLVFLEIR